MRSPCRPHRHSLFPCPALHASSIEVALGRIGRGTRLVRAWARSGGDGILRQRRRVESRGAVPEACQRELGMRLSLRACVVLR
eukprot:2397552-Alexandrium_andersonii.AAC.1